MPGIERLTVDELVRDAERAWQLGIPAVALFPNVAPERRSADGARPHQASSARRRPMNCQRWCG